MPRMTHTDNRYTRSAVSFSDQEEADKTTFAVLFVLVVNFHIIQMWLDIVFIFQLFKGTNLKLTFKAKKYPVDKPKPHEEMSCSGLVNVLVIPVTLFLAYSEVDFLMGLFSLPSVYSDTAVIISCTTIISLII